jgi:hypothetical protein
MRVSRSLPAALALALLVSSFPAPPARAADTGPIKIAVITDMAGQYAALAGAGAVEATKMAVEDFGGKVLGRTVEVVGIDHRNNGPDAAIKAREAYDSGAELALDMTNSAVALAVAGVAKEKHKLAIVTGGASSALTGAACNRYTYHYAYDTYALAASTGSNIAAASNGKSWYALVPNYAFGQQMLADFTAAVDSKGGKIQKADMYPFGQTTDFSSYLLSAKNSGAQVLGLFNAGADTGRRRQIAEDRGRPAVPERRRRTPRRLRRLAHHDVVVLERRQTGARVGRQIRKAHERPASDRHPGLRLLGDVAVASSGQGDRNDRRRQDPAIPRRPAVHRLLRQGRRVARARPPRDPRDVRRRRAAERTSEGAARVVQGRADDPAGPRLPPRIAIGVQEGLVA